MVLLGSVVGFLIVTGMSAAAWGSQVNLPAFNRVEHNSEFGDERDFVRIREVGSSGIFVDEVMLRPGREYEVKVFYHNSAPPEIAMTSAGMASNVRMRTDFPASLGAGDRQPVWAAISADNTTPREVRAQAYVWAANRVYLRFVPGSSIIHNRGRLNGQNISGLLFSDEGALLGFDTFSGIIPGGLEFAGYVTYRFVVEQPRFDIVKQVRVAGQGSFANNVRVTPGDEVEFRIEYRNLGEAIQEHVRVRAVLPVGLEYVDGSTRLYNNEFLSGRDVEDGVVDEWGIGIGNYEFDAVGYVTFRAMVGDDFMCGDATLRSVGIGITGDGERGISADVIVGVECEEGECLPGIMEGDQRCYGDEITAVGSTIVALGAVVMVGLGVGVVYFVRSRNRG